MPCCWLLNLRNGFKVCEVEYQRLAIAIFSGHEAAELKHPAHFRPCQLIGDLSCGQCLQLKSDLPCNACFHLLRRMRQSCLHHGNAGGRVAQHIALCQGRYANKPVLTSLRYCHLAVRPLMPRRAGSSQRLPSARSSSSAKAQSRPFSYVRSGGATRHH